MPESEKIFIEVAYATPATQELLALDVEQNTTAEDAVKLSGILEQFPEIDLNKNKLGILAKWCRQHRYCRTKTGWKFIVH